MPYKRYILSVDFKERIYIGYSYRDIMKSVRELAMEKKQSLIYVLDMDGNIYYEHRPGEEIS